MFYEYYTILKTEEVYLLLHSELGALGPQRAGGRQRVKTLKMQKSTLLHWWRLTAATFVNVLWILHHSKNWRSLSIIQDL